MGEIENGSKRKWMFSTVLAAVFLAVIIVAVFFIVRGGQENENTAAFVIPITFDAKSVSTVIKAILGEEYAVFRHPQLGFSVEYPKELIIEGYEEDDGGETLVFRQQEVPENVNKKVGFQSYIIPFGEEILSRERILKDIPDKAILELQTVTLNPDAEVPVQGLLFWSEAPEIGKTREVWFVHAGYLYAITTYAHLDLWLAKILSTWRFE